MMLKINRQFEPSEQIGNAFEELRKALQEAGAVISRVELLKDRLADEIAMLENERDQLEIYTEAQAAAMIQIKPQLLASLRKQFGLPHCSFGNKPRYTKNQLIEICSILETRRNKPEIRRAA